MDTAIILEPRPAAAASAARDAVDELRRQLATLGWSVATVDVAADAATVLDAVAAAAGSAARLGLVDARTVLHTAVLRALLADARVSSGLLVDTASVPAGAIPEPARAVRIDRGVAVGIASPLQPATAGSALSVGVCVLAHDELPWLSRAMDEMREHVPPHELVRALAHGPVEVLTAAVLAAGGRLAAVDVRGLVALRATDGPAIEAAMVRREQVDEDRAWLDAAVKARDGFFTTFLVSPYSRFLARWSARRGFTPNQVTLVSLGLGVLAAVLFATGQRWPAVAGAVALQLSFTADCVDGQLARYTQRFSAFGAWLDAMFDRGKEYLVFAGLASGAARQGDPGVWDLAAAALVLQVVRHALDFGFGDDRPAPRPPAAGSAASADGPAARRTSDGPGWVLAAASRAERQPALRWAKRIIAFPIGERFAVISLTAALATARLTFTILLAWGAIATAYTALGRLLRARRW